MLFCVWLSFLSLMLFRFFHAGWLIFKFLSNITFSEYISLFFHSFIHYFPHTFFWKFLGLAFMFRTMCFVNYFCVQPYIKKEVNFFFIYVFNYFSSISKKGFIFFFVTFLYWDLCQKSIYHGCGSIFYFTGHEFILPPVLHCFDYCKSLNQIKFPNFVFQFFYGYSCNFNFHVNFRISLSSSTKVGHWDFNQWTFK